MLPYLKNKIYDWKAASDCRASIIALKKLEYLLPDTLTRFAIPWTFRGHGHCKHLTAYQHPVEIYKLYRQILELKPSEVLEIGTARGGTLYLWAQAAQEDARIISIDLPDGPFGGGYRSCRMPFYQEFSGERQNLILIRDNAHYSHTHDQVTNTLDGKGIDFLFIDADHSLRGICKNLCLYGPLVKIGGLIALHDVLENPRYQEIEIWKLWRHLESLKNTTTIDDSKHSDRPLGLGIIKIDARGFQPVSDLIEKLKF